MHAQKRMCSGEKPRRGRRGKGDGPATCIIRGVRSEGKEGISTRHASHLQHNGFGIHGAPPKCSDNKTA
eukprot:366449-Chlamydomonas_euryale.AAC.3